MLGDLDRRRTERMADGPRRSHRGVHCTESVFGLVGQPARVVATPADCTDSRWSLRASAGVLQFSVLRGRLMSAIATASISSTLAAKQVGRLLLRGIMTASNLMLR